MSMDLWTVAGNWRTGKKMQTPHKRFSKNIYVVCLISKWGGGEPGHCLRVKMIVCLCGVQVSLVYGANDSAAEVGLLIPALV